MRVLITGSSGFIGKYVLSELVKNNDLQIVLTTRETESLKHIKHNKVEIRYFDIKKSSTYGNLMQYFNYPDIIVHLAWEGLSNYHESIHNTQLPYHFHLFENLIQNKIKKIVVAGTCLEYGLQEGCLDETMEIKPILPYSIAKAKLLHHILTFQKNYNFKFNWIRLFYMYGKGQSSKSILSQLESAIKNKNKNFNMSKGEQQRDYLPVETVAEYIVKISLQQQVEGIINCCSGKPISIRKLVENYLIQNNQKIELNLGYYPYIDYEPFNFYGDIKKLESALSKK